MTVDQLRDLLAPRQMVVLTYIYDFLEKHCYAPTLREIGSHCGIRSTNGVNDHLLALEHKGFITRVATRARTIVLTCEGYEAVEGAP
jgi:SOS-response transcriptional repressors (RecA-mediated autopeptidases)